MVATSIPERGDVVWIDFDPQAGHEQAGRRPAVVLSPASYNRAAGLAIICPITNKAKGYPFEVAIPAGLKVTGVILADQARNLNWRARNASPITTLPVQITNNILSKLRALL